MPSKKLSDAFDALNEQICDAAVLLRKLPGSDKASIEITGTEGIPDDFQEYSRLEVNRDSEGDVTLVVNVYNHYDDEPKWSKPLKDFPAFVRIRIAHAIPDLIGAACSAESEVADDAIEAANAIEQAISSARD